MVLADVPVGHGQRPFGGQALRHGVAVHAADDVLGIVEPVHLRVAACQPYAGFGHHFGLRGVETRDIRECGSRFGKVALLELSFSHQQPCILQKGVEFLTAEPLLLGIALCLAGIGGRFLLDAVQLYGLFAFCDSRLKVALSQRPLFLIPHTEDGQAFRIVFLQSLVLCGTAFEICLFGIEVYIVACHEGLPPTGRCRGARGTAQCQKKDVWDVAEFH